MAFIEIEMTAVNFNNLVKFIAFKGPIPVPVINALGPTRLIAEFTWNDASIGAAPPGFVRPTGTLTARCNVTLRHVSTSELDTDPSALGLTTNGAAWVLLRVNQLALTMELLAIDVPNAPTQWFMPTVTVSTFPVPNLGGPRPAAATLLMRDDIVTLRFATNVTDDLQATPMNVLSSVGDGWSIRLSGEFFVEQLVARLQDGIAKLPSGTSLEDAPSASWGQHDGQWAAIGSMGVEKEDACPGLFGDVDVSVTIDVVLTPSANIASSVPQLNLTLALNSDASDWDAFRCWLGSGGFLSDLLGYVATPLIGPGAAGLGFLTGNITSLIAIAETVRLDAGREMKDNAPTGFTLVSSSATSALYTNQLPLPTLLTTASNGQTNGVLQTPQTGPFGMLISGSILIVPPTHTRTFNPGSTALASKMQNVYRCKTRRWGHAVSVQFVEITDELNLVGSDFGPVPVTVFPTTMVIPATSWLVDSDSPIVDQIVNVKNVNPSTAKAGDTGRLYLHTSAGLRRYDISPIPPIPEPTDTDTMHAVARCYKNTRIFKAWEEIRWLVDPPPGDANIDPMRQWLFTFKELAEGTRIEINGINQSNNLQQLGVFVATKRGEAAIELITDSGTELVLAHNQQQLDNARMFQRWLIPLRVIDIREPGLRLIRSSSLIVVAQRNGMFTHDFATGASRRQTGEFHITKVASGGIEAVEQRRWRLASLTNTPAAQSTSVTSSQPPETLLPFSLPLPGGKVAALFGSRLLIAVPGLSGGDIET